MRIAILSDIHANVHALESVLKDAEKQGVEYLLCLGDIVGYGAFPGECIQLVRKNCSRAVIGNHDIFAAGDTSLENFSEDARISLEWTRVRLAEEERHYLKALPYILEGDTTTYVHASLHNTKQWEYLDYAPTLRKHFEIQETRVCFVGHTHLPAIFESEELRSAELSWNSPLALPRDVKVVVNAGSVGQPRDLDPRACYVIYDEAQSIVTYRRVRYEIERARNGILAIKMPRTLADRLTEGV